MRKITAQATTALPPSSPRRDAFQIRDTGQRDLTAPCLLVAPRLLRLIAGCLITPVVPWVSLATPDTAGCTDADGRAEGADGAGGVGADRLALHGRNIGSFKVDGGIVHARGLGDATIAFALRARTRCGYDETRHVGAAGHLLIAHGPVHCFCGSPRNLELVGYGLPHVLLVSVMVEA